MKTHNEQIEPINATIRILYWIMRILALFICLALFFPSFNPARISSRINDSVSLFTTAVSYSNLTVRFERALVQGWVEKSLFVLLMISAGAVVIGTLLSAVGACMTLGNDRMRQKGFKFPIIGSAVMLLGILGIFSAYKKLAGSDDSGRLEPILPGFVYIYIVISIVILIVSVLIALLGRRDPETLEEKMAMPEKYSLFLLLSPTIILVFLFSYLPLWGWRYAFFDYSVGGTLSRDNFVGFKWFVYLFKNSATLRDIARVMTNTLAMSGLGLLTSWLPMAFAIGLNEIRSSRLRGIIQTFTTIPNFISWVLIYGIALAIFSTDGFYNNFLNLIGAGGDPVNHLMTDSGIWIKMLLWGTWKSIGWSAIIYIAAIASIDPQLYEAATIDGAGRFAKIWHIIIPGLLPTYLVLLLLQIGGMLSNGLEQYLVFQNPINRDTIEVLDLYVYNIGIDKGRIPISTVVSMAKSLISVALLFIANKASKKIRGESII